MTAYRPLPPRFTVASQLIATPSFHRWNPCPSWSIVVGPAALITAFLIHSSSADVNPPRCALQKRVPQAVRFPFGLTSVDPSLGIMGIIIAIPQPWLPLLLCSGPLFRIAAWTTYSYSPFKRSLRVQVAILVNTIEISVSLEINANCPFKLTLTQPPN